MRRMKNEVFSRNHEDAPRFKLRCSSARYRARQNSHVKPRRQTSCARNPYEEESVRENEKPSHHSLRNPRNRLTQTRQNMIEY